MAVQCPKMTLRVTEVGSSLTRHPLPWQINFGAAGTVRKLRLQTIALSGDGKKPAATPNSNYVVPLDKSSCITRPLAEILRDLNKRVPDNIIKTHDSEHPTSIPWYQANRMLSFYAPGWCGEVRDVIFSENGSVTVVYRVTVRGSDGEGSMREREGDGALWASREEGGHQEGRLSCVKIGCCWTVLGEQEIVQLKKNGWRFLHRRIVNQLGQCHLGMAIL
ncbi:hypothetical protein ACS0TY_017736 [Phlomoides rotata]